MEKKNRIKTLSRELCESIDILYINHKETIVSSNEISHSSSHGMVHLVVLLTRKYLPSTSEISGKLRAEENAAWVKKPSFNLFGLATRRSNDERGFKFLRKQFSRRLMKR